MRLSVPASGIFDCDENSEIVNANWSHEFRKMLGYHDTLDFPNKLESWSDLLHPQDKERMMVQLQAAIKDKTNQIKYCVEYRLRMKDHQYQWFRGIGRSDTPAGWFCQQDCRDFY